jgi:hypothetical protein
MMGEHIPTLLDQPDPAALPFRSHQDALYFASHGAEHSNRILAANNLINVVERYRKGDIELKLALYLSGVRGARKYHLVFFAVPMGIELQPRTSNLDVASNPDSSADCNGVKHFVLRGVTQFIQCPEGVIPSLVRLERFKQAADFRWQILASAGQVIPHVDFGWSEGKFCGFRIGTNVLPADRKCDLIEDGPEVISAVEHNVGELIDKAVNASLKV